jgi:hypothetical protein
MNPNMHSFGAGFASNPSQMFGGMSSIGMDKLNIITQYVMAMINSGAIANPADMTNFDIIDFEDDTRVGMTFVWKKSSDPNVGRNTYQKSQGPEPTGE